MQQVVQSAARRGCSLGVRTHRRCNSHSSSPAAGIARGAAPAAAAAAAAQEPAQVGPSTGSAAGVQGANVPTPLSLRPPVHSGTVDAVLSWRTTMVERVSRIGSSFEEQDLGPSEAELKRELEWVLDDTVAALRSSPSDPWQPCSWRMLGPEVQAAVRCGADAAQCELQLRASVDQLHAWWGQRLQDRVPFQYLIASAHWREHVLAVGPGVLIPRPETEVFADFVAGALVHRPALASLPWADLGTGSGAIAICTAAELRKRCEGARVLAVDLSPVAVAYAAANVRTTGQAGHVTVLQGSWFRPIEEHLAGPPPHLPAQPPTAYLGGVVSNPPYIPSATMAAGLQAEVGRHEPWSALDGGAGAGMDSLQAICSGAVGALVPGGFLALETAGEAQALQVADLLRGLEAPGRQGPQLAGGTVSDPPIDGCSGCAAAPASGAHMARAVGEAAGGPSAFDAVRVVDDCFGVARFVTAYRSL